MDGRKAYGYCGRVKQRCAMVQLELTLSKVGWLLASNQSCVFAQYVLLNSQVWYIFVGFHAFGVEGPRIVEPSTSTCESSPLFVCDDAAGM